MNAMELQKTNLNDYALPLMQIERLAKEIHALCLEHKYEEARLLAQKLCVEGRLLQHVLLLMDEKEKESYANPKEFQARQVSVHS